MSGIISSRGEVVQLSQSDSPALIIGPIHPHSIWSTCCLPASNQCEACFQLLPEPWLGWQARFCPSHSWISALKQKYALKQEVRCNKSGYLQSIDGQGLMHIAEDNDCIIILQHRPGDFLVQDTVLCEFLCNEESGKEVQKQIQDDFISGKCVPLCRMLNVQFIRW